MRLATFAAVAALSALAAAPAGAAGVKVVRGAAPSTAAAKGSVLRGTGYVRPAPAAESARPQATVIAGGSLLWLIDADGQVTACGVRGAGRVGAPDRVHCSAGPVVR